MTSVPGIGLRVAGALLVATAMTATPEASAYYAGGGKDAAKGNDCLIGYENVDADQVTIDGKKQSVSCTDCDPSCDLDGVQTPNGSCTIAVGVCINQSGVEGCTPPSALDKASAKGKVKGVKGSSGKVVIDVSQLLEGSACGALLEVLIPLKETKQGAKDGKASLNLAASVKKNKSEGIAARSDKDKLTFLCQPLPEGQSCPIPTTTTSSSTSTTVEPSSTSTTVASTTSTSLASTTSTTLVSTTSTTLASTTSTTVVSTTSTTSTTLVSTTSTTLVSTTSTTVVTTSTTTTTIDLCGNGVIDGSEECDLGDFGSAECPGSPGGALLCNLDCTINFSLCPAVSTTSTTIGSTTTSTSVPPSTTSTTVESTTTSTSVPPSTTSTTVESTTTSTSIPPTTTSSTTVTSTSTTTTTSQPPATVLRFVTGLPAGVCGAVKSGGSSGAVRKSLACGGLNVGGGGSTVAEGPTPDSAETQFNISGGPTYTVSGRSAAQTGSNQNCSDTGCIFGPYLPIASAGTSTCVQNTFATPGSGTLDSVTGDFDGSVPLSSTVYLTANAASPCPKCVGGTPGVTNSGTCDPTWTAGTGNPYDDAGDPCTPVNASGDTYDCDPPPATVLPSFPVDLTPITTGTASDSDAGGLFCPSQATSGAFGCSGSGAANGICPGGNAPPLIDYIEENGTATGPVTSTPTATTLASVFCIPSVGGSLGFLINAAANLPGPGATSLPGTLTLLP